MSGDYSIDTKKAKHDYFLTAQDLAELPYETLGGWGGWGNRRYYCEEDLREASLQKHGVEGLQKKRLQRATREANKRDKEQRARQAQERLLNAAQQPAAAAVVDLTVDEENANPNPAAAAAPAATVNPVDKKAIASLRNDIKRSFKNVLTWDYLRRKNAPNGTNATVQVMRVEQSEYCALIGRSYDPQLQTLVKKGAWYSDTVDFSTVMGPQMSLVGSGGRHGCNRDLGINPESQLVVKYAPSNKTLSITGYVEDYEQWGDY